MFEQPAFRPQSDSWLAPGARGVEGYGQRAPTQNHLVAALPLAGYERLLPDLKPVALPLGWTVHESGDQDRYLYFPVAGLVCRFFRAERGASTGIAVTGSEGVIGVASFLGGESTPSQAQVLCAGYAYRLRADLVKTQFELNGPLVQLLLRYTQALFTQVGQVVACNRHHSIEQRLCRLLLSCLDRLPSRPLTMTHQRLADVLGVRREAVTEAVGMLRTAGLLHLSRGQIAVLDRFRLETRACECYEVVRREDDRLLADYRRAKVASSARPVARVHAFPQPNAARV